MNPRLFSGARRRNSGAVFRCRASSISFGARRAAAENVWYRQGSGRTGVNLNQGLTTRPGAERAPARGFFRLLAAAALTLGLLAASGTGAETAKGEVGGYRYRLVVPEGEPAAGGRPLLVLLHGCKQSAADIARLSGLDRLADIQGVAVLYPETGPSVGNPYGCWVWWAPQNQIPKGGEAEVIVEMVNDAASIAPVDRERIYAVGLSSGGAMSAILGALYPDVFAAVGVHSGMPYAAAGDTTCALRAMSDGDSAAESRATVAYHAQGQRHRPLPLMVIHGDEDNVVTPENAEHLIRQFAQLNDMADDGDGANQSIDAGADITLEDQTGDGRSFRVRVYHDARGVEIMREVIIAGMGHAWSGGPAETEYSDPKGPDAASLFWSFFENRTINDPPVRKRKPAACQERYGSNFAHHWWHRRMSREEYRCDPWGWSWRRGYDGEWTAGRCP